MKYVIFNPKLPGEILDPIITENIIQATKRGNITKAAQNLMLVPDKRKYLRDKRGIKFYGWEKVKKSECIPLRSLVLK